MTEPTVTAAADTVIWSGEHRSYWRRGESGRGEGYTRNLAEAGRWTAAEAAAETSHCGPDKKIELRRAPAPSGQVRLVVLAVDGPMLFDMLDRGGTAALDALGRRLASCLFAAPNAAELDMLALFGVAPAPAPVPPHLEARGGTLEEMRGDPALWEFSRGGDVRLVWMRQSDLAAGGWHRAVRAAARP